MPNEIAPEVEGEKIGIYTIIKTIGQGSYGKVAVKIINKQNIKNIRQATRIKREIRFLKLLHHPHIVKVWDVLESQDHIYIIMEFAKGDLKPENLLLDENKNIKIIDFGFSNTFKMHQFLETFCGSPFYAAPEMVLGQKYEGPEVDVWSLGIILFTLLCGHLPFDDPNPKDLYRKILSGVFSIPDFVCPEAKDLICRMICVDPRQRATIEQVKQHRWLNLGYESIVNSYFPIRQVLAFSQLNREILGRLESFGYSLKEIETAFNDPTLNNPIANTYYLILEMFQKEEFKLKASIASSNSKLALSQSPSFNRLYSIKENNQSKEINENGAVPMELSAEAGNGMSPPPIIFQPPDLPPKHYRKASLNEEAAAKIPLFLGARHLHQNAATGLGPQAALDAPLPTAGKTAVNNSHLLKDDKHKRRFSLPILDEAMQTPPKMVEGHAASPGEPLRTMNGWFFTVATTSSMDPDSILQEVARILLLNNVACQREAAYILRCFWPASKVEFEIEVCRVPRLNLNGLNFKRLQGSFWSYKKICNKLISQMNL